MSALSMIYASGLAAVAGYNNALCLLRFQAYGTMMTGNILMMANAVTTGNISHAHDGNVFPDLVFYALIVVAHYLGIFLHALAAQQQCTYTIMFLGPVSLVVTFVAELMTGIVPARWVVFAVAMNFGLQSAITQRVIGFATILATGHLSNLFACLNSHILGGGMTGKPEQVQLNFAIIYALVLGALAGAWVNIHAEHFVFTPVALIQLPLLLGVERASVSQKLMATSESATQLVDVRA
jgi:hypothetical protein